MGLVGKHATKNTGLPPGGQLSKCVSKIWKLKRGKFFLVFSRFWWLQVLLGLWLHHPDLCLRLFMVLSSVSVSPLLFLILLFSPSVVSKSLGSHGLQHARLPCPSPYSRVCSNSRALSQWYHPTILPSVSPFSCLRSFPASGSFLRSQFFASSGQSIGASASASVLPVKIHWVDFL